jgi:hypothetical protein
MSHNAVNQNTAKATLTQMLNIIFNQRMEQVRGLLYVIACAFMTWGGGGRWEVVACAIVDGMKQGRVPVE